MPYKSSGRIYRNDSYFMDSGDGLFKQMKEAKVLRFSLYLFLSVLFIFAVHKAYYNSKNEMILEKNKDIIPLQEEVQELFDDIDFWYEVVTIEKKGGNSRICFLIYEET